MASIFTNAKVVAQGVSAESYVRQEPGIERGDPRYVMGRSSLMECFTNPFRWVNGYEEQDTKSTEWGTLRDCLVLDGANFDKRFIVRPATYPAPSRHAKVRSGEINEGDPVPWSHAATWCKEWTAEHEDGKIIVSPKDMEKNKKADQMLGTDIEVAKVLTGAAFQVLVIAEYKDKPTGLVIPVKILIDIVPDASGPYKDSLADFKTAQSADPISWSKTVGRYDYHVQGAFYLDIYAAAMPAEDRFEFRHVVQENVNPFVPETHALDKDFLDIGRNLYEQALEKYCHCLKSKTWSRYSPAPPPSMCVNGWHYATPTSRDRERAIYRDPSWLKD